MSSIYDYRGEIVLLTNGNFKVIPHYAGEHARGDRKVKSSGFEHVGNPGVSVHENAVRLARQYFGGGALKVDTRCVLPTKALEAYGISRETAPVGEVSVLAPYFMVRR